ncbi:MAG: ssl1498 family light-harvesting-like protein [Calothrix sp. MO_167.B42]|nr:ssl1498 family light-harvesting-like protein [Calothrix sp. MO_167.B42]
MYTTSDERGILNNFASEPKLYYAEYPSTEQQNQYKILGVVAMLLVSAVITIAFTVS